MTRARGLRSGFAWDQLMAAAAEVGPPQGRVRSDSDALLYTELARQGNEDPIPRSLALSVHLPAKTRPSARVGGASLFGSLAREVALKAPLFDRDRVVERIHLTEPVTDALSGMQLTELMHLLEASFALETAASREYSAVIAGARVDPKQLHLLSRLGFNQLTLRLPAEPAAELLAALTRHLELAASMGWSEVTVELECALWRCGGALRPVLALAADRVLLRQPVTTKGNAQCSAVDPCPRQARVNPLQWVQTELAAAGYRGIGNELFVRPDDRLLIAQARGELHYDCHGYSSGAERDHIGFGPGAMSRLGYSYAYNEAGAAYRRRLSGGVLPTARVAQLSADARIRYDVYQHLMCYGRVPFGSIEQRHRISFGNYFAAELAALQWLTKRGRLRLAARALELDDGARWLLPYICRVFTDITAQPAVGRLRFCPQG